MLNVFYFILCVHDYTCYDGVQYTQHRGVYTMHYIRYIQSPLVVNRRGIRYISLRTSRDSDFSQSFFFLSTLYGTRFIPIAGNACEKHRTKTWSFINHKNFDTCVLTYPISLYTIKLLLLLNRRKLASFRI